MTSLWETIRSDAARWANPGEIADPAQISTARSIELLVRHRALRATSWYRVGHWAHQRGIKGASWAFQALLQRRYGLDIVISMPVGPGFYLAHPVGVALAARCIGDNVTITTAVTLGVNGPGNRPVLGDNVFVGAGARIIGQVEVGDNAKIGANAVVNFDVEEGHTVVGTLAKPTAKSLAASKRQNLDGEDQKAAAQS